MHLSGGDVQYLFHYNRLADSLADDSETSPCPLLQGVSGVPGEHVQQAAARANETKRLLQASKTLNPAAATAEVGRFFLCERTPRFLSTCHTRDTSKAGESPKIYCWTLAIQFLQMLSPTWRPTLGRWHHLRLVY